MGVRAKREMNIVTYYNKKFECIKPLKDKSEGCFLRFLTTKVTSLDIIRE